MNLPGLERMKRIVFVATLTLAAASRLHASSWTDAVKKELDGWEGSYNYEPLIPVFRLAFLEGLPHRVFIVAQAGGSAHAGSGGLHRRRRSQRPQQFGRLESHCRRHTIPRLEKWRTSGNRCPAKHARLIDFLKGVLSPADLMLGSYAQFVREPKNFRSVDKGASVEYTPLNMDFLNNFTFAFQKKPLWLLGFKTTPPDGTRPTELRFSPPEPVKKIPQEFMSPPDVEFAPGEIPWRDLIPYI